MNGMIRVVMQAFYGNKNICCIPDDAIDRYIFGVLDKQFVHLIKEEDMDRTIVKIPNTDNLVLIYNKHLEEDDKKCGIKETANIPEIGLVLHSRCIVCRMNSDGEFENIEREDLKKIDKYLSD